LERVPAALREAAMIMSGIPADSKEAIMASPVTVTLN
jgi:hypothetical protein